MSLQGLLSVAGAFEPQLPPHCEPANAFLYRLSSTFHTCVPSNLALVSTLLGTCSIIAWLFAQLPQIYKNFKLHSTSGLSVFFLGEWLLGDLSNLLGCLFTGQATWQIVIASYYCSVDCMLMGQYIWYEWLKHGRPLRKVWWPRNKENNNNKDVIDGISIYSQSTLGDDSSSVASKPIDTPMKGTLRPDDIRGQFRMPRYSASPAEYSLSSSLSSTPQRGLRIPAGSSPTPSPRTVLYISLLLAVVAQASPLHAAQGTNEIEFTDPVSMAGTVLSWLSTLLYLGSRLPQLYKNHKRKSTAGLSPALFIAAFFGNLFYSSSMLANPNAWSDFEPYGGGGWVGEEGNNRAEWVARATPFFLGAAGVLIMDACVGLQFLVFGEIAPEPVIVVEERKGRRWRWRRVSGWMRGWMPSVSVAGTPGVQSPILRPHSGSDVGERDRLLIGSSKQQVYGSV
ncbi:uncharacterized protein PV09_05258 [Verruconis gallopava]|uniref:PQ loop repeat protein n=1 Tax=Verruconis gallopava TaxID=253628 RepID=A0A0D1XM54_9PEZI|nr:uncharacterized protein PV09_05258 [Verruconis gallopava]KIW03491.1 hypothetical protein PV09_05258 [Verruconis gallopava]